MTCRQIRAVSYTTLQRLIAKITISLVLINFNAIYIFRFNQPKQSHCIVGDKYCRWETWRRSTVNEEAICLSLISDLFTVFCYLLHFSYLDCLKYCLHDMLCIWWILQHRVREPGRRPCFGRWVLSLTFFTVIHHSVPRTTMHECHTFCIVLSREGLLLLLTG